MPPLPAGTVDWAAEEPTEVASTGTPPGTDANQGPDCRFCRWVAWPGLAEKECFFGDTGTSLLRSEPETYTLGFRV